ncbi:MAG: hypothetical protein LBJ43_01650 [Propionibacteriaceae bacterium]|nr:hypothetical protein [Propionibacteriaceae bacterium]
MSLSGSGLLNGIIFCLVIGDPPAQAETVAADGMALLLVKPQFEVGRAALNSKGVVRDEQAQAESVAVVAATVQQLGWRTDYCAPSALPGEHGNIEWFLGLRKTNEVLGVEEQ